MIRCFRNLLEKTATRLTFSMATFSPIRTDVKKSYFCTSLRTFNLSKDVFKDRPGIPFTFVYFNHKTPSSDFFFKFKAVFDLIPLRVIEKMRNFYLIKPYFYIKAFDWLGHSNKVFAERY